MSDTNERSVASTGSVDGRIDVEELMGELHRIAGSERIDIDVRRTARDAERAIDSLRAWVNQLQLCRAEKDALEIVALSGYAGVKEMAAFSGLLERVR